MKGYWLVEIVVILIQRDTFCFLLGLDFGQKKTQAPGWHLRLGGVASVCGDYVATWVLIFSVVLVAVATCV